jgi:hypothetical protein
LSTSWLLAVGSVVKRVGPWPLAIAIGAYWVGKWTSQWIDPDEGKENYYGFISGGIYGADPNYRSYFNVGLNTQIILSHYISEIMKEPTTTTKYTTSLTDQVFINKERRDAWVERYMNSFTSGTFQTTSTYLFQQGMISSEEYLRRITKEQAQAAKAKWDKKAKEEAQSKWKSLSKSEQKDITNSQRQLQGAVNFW